MKLLSRSAPRPNGRGVFCCSGAAPSNESGLAALATKPLGSSRAARGYSLLGLPGAASERLTENAARVSEHDEVRLRSVDRQEADGAIAATDVDDLTARFRYAANRTAAHTLTPVHIIRIERDARRDEDIINRPGRRSTGQGRYGSSATRQRTRLNGDVKRPGCAIVLCSSYSHLVGWTGATIATLRWSALRRRRRSTVGAVVVGVNEQFCRRHSAAGKCPAGTPV